MFIYLVAWIVLTCVFLLLFRGFETAAKEDWKGISPDITVRIWSLRHGSPASVALVLSVQFGMFPFVSRHNSHYDTYIYLVFELVKHNGAHLCIFPSENLPRQEGILFNLSWIDAFGRTDTY